MSLKADKTELNGLATESWVEAKNYLTEHQDISNLVTKDDFDKLEKSIPSLEGYAKVEDIPSTEGFVTET